MSLKELREALKEKNLTIGSEETIKKLKTKKLTKVFLSSNCKKETEEDIRYYAKLGNVKVIKLEIPSDEVGAICKKPFMISVLSC